MVCWDRCGRHVRASERTPDFAPHPHLHHQGLGPKEACEARVFHRATLKLSARLKLWCGSPVRVRHVQSTRVAEVPLISYIMRGYLSAPITRNSLTLIAQRGRRVRKLYATSIYSEGRTDMLQRAGILILVFRVNASQSTHIRETPCGDPTKDILF